MYSTRYLDPTGSHVVARVCGLEIVLPGFSRRSLAFDPVSPLPSSP